MLKVIVVILAVIACPTLWITIIVPLIARSIGLPFKIGSLPIDRRDKRIARVHSFWLAGVLGWGVGISVLGVLTAIFIDRTRPTIDLLYGAAACCLVTALWTQGDWTYPLDGK